MYDAHTIRHNYIPNKLLEYSFVCNKRIKTCKLQYIIHNIIWSWTINYTNNKAICVSWV